MNFIIATITATALLNTAVLAQDLSSTIVGCLEVGCPVDGAGTSSKCTVVDKTYGAIGLARVPGVSSTLAGVSWTEGVAVVDQNGKDRNFNKNFYFGIPPDKNLTGIGACAVFFNEVSDTVVFPEKAPEHSVEVSRGTCEDAMGSGCVNALKKRAIELDVNGLGTAEACSKLQKAFNENLDSACKTATRVEADNRWTGITVKALTGQDSALPISASQNSSSNCWPILPKQNSLTLVSSTDTPGDNSAESASKNLYKITPILTLFYPGNGSLITKSEAQLTCMKTINLGAGDNKTKNDGGKKGTGTSCGPRVAVVTCFALACLIFFGL